MSTKKETKKTFNPSRAQPRRFLYIELDVDVEHRTTRTLKGGFARFSPAELEVLEAMQEVGDTPREISAKLLASGRRISANHVSVTLGNMLKKLTG